MYYNFYLFIIILAIISPINAYNRETILKDITVENEIIIVSSGIIFIYILSQLIMKKDILPKDIETKTIGYLIINIVLASSALYLGGTIIKKSNVLRFKSLQKPIYLVLLVIIACVFYEKKCNFQVLLGIALLVGGCILVDRNLQY
jgi:uncharacterized membrane protein